MATVAKKKEFLCIMPDRPNALELRKKVKGGHYEGIQPLISSGKLVDGGAIFEEHPQQGKDSQFLGSVVVYTGENIEEVRELINNDIYARSGVWDLERVQIYPIGVKKRMLDIKDSRGNLFVSGISLPDYDKDIVPANSGLQITQMHKGSSEVGNDETKEVNDGDWISYPVVNGQFTYPEFGYN
ncbi:uncharacterized protein N7511_003779 [Penicillium nucicola]|uniref:uncharacterized protein n=1 Tax=Penicillium nucicola TaxID=1850975 RepID=UPI00254553B6|nr:uncharacterized protein N7511_003779 [Penicillium nucicola]KAJ5766163.1 hypothetical protein N7511_003779 [Penicillium nucicola]